MKILPSLLLLFAAMPMLASPPACDRHSSLTPFAVDTTAGRVLFSMVTAAGRRGLIDFDGDGRLWAAGESTVFAGSVGPGEPFAVERCGADCLQPVVWSNGRWQTFGEAFTAPRRALVVTTWDLAGKPWVLARDGDPAQIRAYRLENGEWRPQGQRRALVTASDGAFPDPGDPQAVIFGGVRFVAGGAPQGIVAGLPRGIDGDLLSTGGDHRLLLDPAGRVFRSADRGAGWSLDRWAPWGVQTTRSWEPGRDYLTLRPVGDGRGDYPLAWFDRRRGDQPRLVLTTWSPEGGWRVQAELSPQIATLDGSMLAYDYLLRPRPDRWLLLTGCVHTTAGSHLSLRDLTDGGELSPARLVPLAGAP